MRCAGRGNAAVWLWPLVRAATCGVLLGTQGCSTTLEAGRVHFRSGHLELAEQAFSRVKLLAKDEVLFYMERGTVRQAAGWLEASTDDYLTAFEVLRRLDTYSVRADGSSLVVNDNVQPFRGAPFERTLLHAMTALNHLGRGHWDEAAVEARRLLYSLDPAQRGDYPEDAFSRYVAALCFELQDDFSNAALQYRLASALTTNVKIEPETGRLHTHQQYDTPIEDDESPPSLSWIPREPGQELIVFLMLGRAASVAELLAGSRGLNSGSYAEIWSDNRLLGRSYLLTDVDNLAIETDRKLTRIKAAKTTTRFFIKEKVAQWVEHNSDRLWGDLVRLILLGFMEEPDVRRWETLPGAFHVARVSTEQRLDCYTLIIKNSAGQILSKTEVTFPLQHRRQVSTSWFWDLPVPQTLTHQPTE